MKKKGSKRISVGGAIFWTVSTILLLVGAFLEFQFYLFPARAALFLVSMVAAVKIWQLYGATVQNRIEFWQKKFRKLKFKMTLVFEDKISRLHANMRRRQAKRQVRLNWQ